MKYNCKKKVLSFAIACILIISTGTFMANAQEISPCYNNVVSAQSQANVSSTGVITITNNYVADSTVFSKAQITTYIEKRTVGNYMYVQNFEQDGIAYNSQTLLDLV